MGRRDWARHLRRGKREEIEAREEGRSRGSRKRRRRRGHAARRFVLLAVLLVFLLGGLYLLLSGAATGGGGEAVTVTVERGETLSGVAGKLEGAGVVGSAALFELRARLSGGEAEIKAGEYRFEPGQGTAEILETLSSGDSTPAFVVTVPEGLTLGQTARVVEEEAGVPAGELEAAAARTDYGYPFLEGARTTEGFLFPKQYEFETGAGAAEIVERMLGQYDRETEGLDFGGARERLGLTEYEVVTAASLIERESANPEERPLIAAVIYNRIRAGMPLQIDATVQYALGEPKKELSLDDLEIDSPYNTYENLGLPPGPIASPSRESIEAALSPADAGYLYYVLEADGEEHFFTDDYDEFLEAKEEAERGR